jgi:hypothetical protein
VKAADIRAFWGRHALLNACFSELKGVRRQLPEGQQLAGIILFRSVLKMMCQDVLARPEPADQLGRLGTFST